MEGFFFCLLFCSLLTKWHIYNIIKTHARQIKAGFMAVCLCCKGGEVHKNTLRRIAVQKHTNNPNINSQNKIGTTLSVSTHSPNGAVSSHFSRKTSLLLLRAAVDKYKLTGRTTGCCRGCGS